MKQLFNALSILSLLWITIGGCNQMMPQPTPRLCIVAVLVVILALLVISKEHSTH